MPKYTEAEKKQVQEQCDFAATAGRNAAGFGVGKAWFEYRKQLEEAGMSAMVIANAKTCFLNGYRLSVERQISEIRGW